VPLIQTLRRRRLKPATVSAYTSEAKSFLETNSLPSAPAPPNLVSLLTLNLIEVYLRGAGGGGVARRYYAVRWWYCLDNSSLRLAYESMLASLPRSASPDPICWEEALIMALYLLRVKLPRDVGKAARAAAAILVSFDVFARGGDAPQMRHAELRPPQTSRGLWTLTFFPSTHEDSSKVHTKDHTVEPFVNPERAWLKELLPLLRRRRPKQGLLFDITPNDWVSLFAESREATGLKKANPHQLRHGGASADAMQKPPPPDLELMGRGDWSQPKSVKVYRRTGIYARRMQMLTPGQRATAATARHLILALFKQRLFQ
jgi:hypothetical protein